MLKATLLRYTHYNHWANDLLLGLIEKGVKEDLLDKKLNSSFPSLRKTIYHIWDAEYIWLNRLLGKSPTTWPSETFSGAYSNAREKILLTGRSFIDLVETRSEEELSIPFTYQNIEGKSFSNPVWESILHCMNHSTYHRGQLVTMLRQLDVKEIPSTDFISFVRVKR